MKANAHNKTYLPTAGMLPLREAIAEHTTKRVGGPYEYTAENVLVGPGTKELIFLMQLCLDADLMLQSASWVTYQPQSSMLGRRALWLDTSAEVGWKLHPDILDDALRQQAQYSYQYPVLLVINYPSNPTGSSYTDEELQAIAEICRRHGILVLSDEIYGRLTYNEEYPHDEQSAKLGLRHTRQHKSIAAHYPEGTVVLDGISKWAGAGGWRLGAFVFPKELSWLRNTMIAAASETYSSVCAPVQHAAMGAFQEESGRGEAVLRYLDRANHVLRLVSSYTVRTLKEAGAKVQDPAGGFYTFPDFSKCPGLEPVRARY